METEEDKGEDEEEKVTTRNLVKVVRAGLAKNDCYLDLVGQVGSTPLEFFEDMVRQEKDLLKHQKSNFKQLVK